MKKLVYIIGFYIGLESVAVPLQLSNIHAIPSLVPRPLPDFNSQPPTDAYNKYHQPTEFTINTKLGTFRLVYVNLGPKKIGLDVKKFPSSFL